MVETLIFDGIFLIVFLKHLQIDASCDIFLYNKCPLPPMSIKNNVEQFCGEAQKHVDCVNRRLEHCSDVQEYGPALETLKLTFRSYLTDANSHGCNNLYDKIRIPRRLPRKKPSTKKPRRRKSKKRRTTISAVEYHCRSKLIVDSCGPWDFAPFYQNRSICQKTFHYARCLAPLKLKCQNLFSDNEQIQRIQAFLQICYQKYVKTPRNRIDARKSNFFILFLDLFVFLFFRIE